MKKKLAILGIRGVPARHGGFETFAEHLALYLVRKGWEVTVYCQGDDVSRGVYEDEWEGVKRITIPVAGDGAAATVSFDWKTVMHEMGQPKRLCLTLGYNTASFLLGLRFGGVRNLINMDGIEWKRDKWKWYERAWLWLNERCGCWFGNHLVADHPEIANHLATRVARKKITMIPYGANPVESAAPEVLERYGLKPGKYAIVIARPEPENSILEIVRAFSRKPRDQKLLVLGRYEKDKNPFHAEVLRSASQDVIFPGAIYEKEIVESLRYHACFYVHGHRVGGTNPSLVEALGARSAVLAHDNKFNRWVAGDGACYFKDEDECAKLFDVLFSDDQQIARMKKSSVARFEQEFTWEHVLSRYEGLLESWL
jgi:glycosyltransferase involved in cell wall biosynthesis